MVRDNFASMIKIDAASAILAFAQSPTGEEMIATGREEMAPWQRRCIQGYIALNMHSKIRVMDLVRVVRFSPRRFDRVFKKTFDCTPHQYIVRMRIARARKLLLGTDDSLSKIAAECGFGNQSHLSNLFRKTMGQSPGTWRRLHGIDRRDQERPAHSGGISAVLPAAASLTSDKRILNARG
jgi:transcriptional regulator GlxA family with amidase domain